MLRAQLKRELTLVIASAIHQFSNTMRGANAFIEVIEIKPHAVHLTAHCGDHEEPYEIKIDVKEWAGRRG